LSQKLAKIQSFYFFIEGKIAILLSLCKYGKIILASVEKMIDKEEEVQSDK